MSRVALYAVIVIAIAAADQIVKRLVVDGMELYERIDVLPFLSLYHTRNTGIAFSLLAGLDDTLMLVVTALVIGFVIWLMSRSGEHQRLARVGFALILGGALGNLVDRAMLGYVVDYVLFHTASWSFAVFNFADACITVGAGLVLLQELVDWRRGGAEGRDREPPPGR